jgi:hypothetical protein
MGEWARYPVPSNWYFMDDETVRIVILLRPAPQGLRPHVPCECADGAGEAAESERVQNVQLTQALDAALAKETDELRRLKLIMTYESALVSEGSALARARHAQAQSVLHTHPSDLAYSSIVETLDARARVVRREPRPPDTFICPACDDTGSHFRAYCPLLRSRFEPSAPGASSDPETATAPAAAKTLRDGGDEDEPMLAPTLASPNGGIAEAPGTRGSMQAGKLVPLDRLTVLKGVPVNFLTQKAHGESKTITSEGVTVAVVDRQIVPRAHLPLYSHLLSTGQGSVAETIRVYEEALPPLVVPPPRGSQLDFEPYIEALGKRMDLLESKFYADHPHLAKKGTQCLHFLKGKCHKGYLVCEFAHNLAAKRAVCAFFAENKCKAGKDCAFIHPEQIQEYMIRPEKTQGLAPSVQKNKSAVDAAKVHRRASGRRGGN